MHAGLPRQQPLWHHPRAANAATSEQKCCTEPQRPGKIGEHSAASAASILHRQRCTEPLWPPATVCERCASGPPCRLCFGIYFNLQVRPFSFHLLSVSHLLEHHNRC